jgi:hypothetical protein
MKVSKPFKTLLGHGLSFKLPLRLLAILAILFLTLAVGVLTYRGGVEIWGFFKVEHIAATLPGRFISQMMGWMMAVSTFVQSAPVIWNKLSAWGQQIDNLMMKWIFHQTYFLDEVKALLGETRKLINAMNQQLLETSKEITYGKKLSLEKSNEIFSHSLKKAYENCEKVVALLKNNEPYDNWSRERKTRADEELNNFTLQLTDTFQKSQALSHFS